MPGIGPHSRAWSATIVSPAGGDNASDLDDLIQDITRDIGQRFDEEHSLNVGVGGGGADKALVGDGEHRPGSAVIGYDTLANRVGSVTTVGLDRGPLGNNLGRVYRASDTGQVFVSDGVADWHELVTAMAGNSLNQIDLLSNAAWLKAGADAMDMHAHKGRHLSAVSGVGAGDRIPLLIEGVFTAAASGVSAAGTGDKLSITGLDYSTRTGNSTIVVLAVVNWATVSGGASSINATFRLQHQNGAGARTTITLSNGILQETGAASGSGAQDVVLIGYSISIPAAADQRVHVEMFSGSGNEALDAVSMIIFDLGQT